jgi:glyoxylase-like metal-dependent hydrolase (beta-lactamase superfamily II)
MGDGWRVAREWYRAIRIDDRITRIDEPFVAPLLRCNIWHVRGRDRDLVVDGGLGVTSLRDAFPELMRRETIAVATHTHVDHIGCLHEFDRRGVHRAEAGPGAGGVIPTSLRGDRYSTEFRNTLETAGYAIPTWLISAIPSPNFDPDGFVQPTFEPNWLFDEGDVVDLGDSAFEVLHLPGHSPGSLGLWETGQRLLLSGDAIYDGPLLDRLPGSSVERYLTTMDRLRILPADSVHAGHDPSFGRDRLHAIATTYLDRHGA